MSKTLVKFLIRKFLKVDGKSTSLGNQPAYKHGKKWKGNWNDKPLPPYLTKREAKNLKRVMNFAHTLDGSLFSFGPINIGWGAVYGLVPFVGDFLDAILAAIVVIIIMRIVPWRDEKKQPDHLKLGLGMLAFMWIQVFALFAIGIVPLAGDLIDSLLQCNKRNAKMIYKHLQNLSDSRGPGWLEVTRKGKGKMTRPQEHQDNALGIQMFEQPGATGFPYPAKTHQRTDSHGRRPDPRSEFGHHSEDTGYATDTGHVADVQHADAQRAPYTYNARGSPSPADTQRKPQGVMTWKDLQRKVKEVEDEKERGRQRTRGRQESPLRNYTPSPRSHVVSPESGRPPAQRTESGWRSVVFGGSREPRRDLERGGEEFRTPPQRPARGNGKWI